MKRGGTLARSVVLLMATAIALAGCGHARADYIAAQEAAGNGTGGDTGGGTDANGSPLPSDGDSVPVQPVDPAPLGVQLDTFFGASAAGMYNAAVSGYYAANAIEAGFIPGTPDQDPIAAVMEDGGPEVLMASVPAVLQARETTGADLVLVAQLFQRSGNALVAPKGTRLDSLKAFKGKAIGTLTLGSRGLDLAAALAAAGLGDGAVETVGDYDFVPDPSMVALPDLLRSASVAAAEVTVWDEYAQLQEFGTQDGQDPYTAGQLTTQSLDVSGDSLLGEGIFVRASWLAADPANGEALVRFLRATFEGYADCRDHVLDCAQLTVDQGAPLPVGHQEWGVNEVNALIWPAPGGIGALPDGGWDATIKRLVDTGLLAAPPPAAAVDLSYAEKARSTANGLDLVATGFTKGTVAITPGGEGSDPVPSIDPGDNSGTGDASPDPSTAP
ncbi:MAG: ABC transporter substrate-binding protein [Chloroflexota bacterium]